MADGWTNKGLYQVLGMAFRNTTEPTNFYMALVTSATVPSATTNVLSDLTEIAAGNGYTSGGYSLDRNSTDFDVYTEDDGAGAAYIQMKDIVWTASGGSIPSSGGAARYAVLTDDDVTVADREVYAFFDLDSSRTATTGQSIRLENGELKLSS